MSEPLVEEVKHAARDIDGLPSNPWEAKWLIFWFVVLSFINYLMEYLIWAPFWSFIT